MGALDTIGSRPCREVLDAGADAVQVFDTWAGELRREDWQTHVRPSLARIVQTIRGRGGRVMVFSRHPGHLLEDALQLGAHGVSLDHRVDLATAAKLRPTGVALQGNLDPIELFAPAEHIRRRVREMAAAAGQGWIANLGHGCIPTTPIDGMAAFVDAVHELAVRPV